MTDGMIRLQTATVFLHRLGYMYPYLYVKTFDNRVSDVLDTQHCTVLHTSTYTRDVLGLLLTLTRSAIVQPFEEIDEGINADPCS